LQVGAATAAAVTAAVAAAAAAAAAALLLHVSWRHKVVVACVCVCYLWESHMQYAACKLLFPGVNMHWRAKDFDRLQLSRHILHRHR